MRRASWVVPAVTTLLLWGQFGTASTASGADGDDVRTPVEARVDAPTAVGSDPADAATVVPAGSAGEPITAARHTVAVAPGLRHTSFDTLDARGWLRGDILTAELQRPGLEVSYLGAPSVSQPAPLSDAVARADAVAGVNGDFFDIGDTGAPLGVGIDRAHGVVHGQASEWNRTFAVDALGAAWIGRTFLDATLTLPTLKQVTVTNLNSAEVEAGGIGVYTSLWGAASRARVVDNSQSVRRLHVVAGEVTATSVFPGRGPIPVGTTVIIGRGAGADLLAKLRRGDRVHIDYGVRSAQAGRLPVVAVGGQQVLLEDGLIVAGDDGLIAPRTAIGIDDDGGRLIVLTVDGRQEHSRGTSLRETAQLLLDLGAEDALNLDGGGSSTMLARRPGERPRVVNKPSDGQERNVPNGLGFVTAPGSGRLAGLQVRRLVDDPDSYAAPLEVLAGLSVQVMALGHDEMLAPVAATPTWSTSDAAVATAERISGRAALVRAVRPGEVRVRARAGSVRGATTVVVRGRPVRVFTDVEQVVLSGEGDRASFTVQAADRAGHRTEVAPRDVHLDYNREAVRVRPVGDGFEVIARRDRGRPVIAVGVGRAVRELPVSIAGTSTRVSGLDEVGGWSAAAARSASDAQLSTAEGVGDGAIALAYDFGESASTRAAYLDAPSALPLPGDPDSLSMLVRGDGQHGQLRATVRDATGVLSTVDLAQDIDFTGWRRLEAELPQSLVRPLEFVRAYVVETDPTRAYSGRLVFDRLAVSQAPELPAVADPWRDPLINDRLEGDDSGFAVLGGAGISASGPVGRVEEVRAALAEIAATDPAFVVVLGDLVDSAFDGDLALAEQVLDEQLVGVPWHYVPGEAEAGDDDLAAWRARFGEPVRTFDSAGSRFVLLDSSKGSLRASDFEQLHLLQDTLDTAAVDDSIHSVVVLANNPIAGVGNAPATDPLEADLVQQWLAEFAERTGKGAAVLAADPVRFSADRIDGVHHVLTGPVAGLVPDGGFSGWTTFVAAPGDGARWLRAQVRPHLDAAAIRAPVSVPVGATVDVAATVTQAGRTVPASYPMSVRWTVSPSGALAGNDCRGCAAVLDADAGTVRAMRPGRVTIGVEVSGTLVQRVIRVLPRT